MKTLLIILVFITLSYKDKSENFSKHLNPQINSTIIENKFPQKIGFVNDFEKILTHSEKIELEKIIKNYEKKTKNEIVIITVNSIKPYNDPYKFSDDIFNNWKVGKKNGKGLSILVSKSLRKIAVSVTPKAQKYFTDEIINNTIQPILIPELKKGKYFDGLKKTLEEITTNWK
ncbi:MAG: TPM domain-containing protein [Flavobacterium sp.]|nr:TPM domain-containing protein [Flavobacterium sp.]